MDICVPESKPCYRKPLIAWRAGALFVAATLMLSAASVNCYVETWYTEPPATLNAYESTFWGLHRDTKGSGKNEGNYFDKEKVYAARAKLVRDLKAGIEKGEISPELEERLSKDDVLASSVDDFKAMTSPRGQGALAKDKETMLQTKQHLETQKQQLEMKKKGLEEEGKSNGDKDWDECEKSLVGIKETLPEIEGVLKAKKGMETIEGLAIWMDGLTEMSKTFAKGSKIAPPLLYTAFAFTILAALLTFNKTTSMISLASTVLGLIFIIAFVAYFVSNFKKGFGDYSNNVPESIRGKSDHVNGKSAIFAIAALANVILAAILGTVEVCIGTK